MLTNAIVDCALAQAKGLLQLVYGASRPQVPIAVDITAFHDKYQRKVGGERVTAYATCKS